MKKEVIYRLMDILEDLKKIDSLILLHSRLDDSKFMVSQYEAKKNKLIGSLIDGLISPEVQSPQNFVLIKAILKKYYPQKDRHFKFDGEMARLAASI